MINDILKIFGTVGAVGARSDGASSTRWYSSAVMNAVHTGFYVNECLA